MVVIDGEIHRLHLQIVLEGVCTLIPPPPRLLVPSEGHAHIQISVVVDAHSPGSQTPRDPHGFCKIFGEDSGCQSKFCIVCSSYGFFDGIKLWTILQLFLFWEGVGRLCVVYGVLGIVIVLMGEF